MLSEFLTSSAPFQQLSRFIADHSATWYGISFVQTGSAVLTVLDPSQHLMHPQLIFTGSTAQEAEKSLNVNTSQQQLKYVIKIILILDLKQSTFPASRKKINLMLAETRTHCNGKSFPNRTRHFHFKCTFHFSSN